MPSARTTVMPMSRSRTPPKRCRHGPAVPVAMTPPSVAVGSGWSIANCCPAAQTVLLTLAIGVPASACTTKSPAAWSTTSSAADTSSSRSTAPGALPQSSLLPDPLGTTRRPCSAAIRIAIDVRSVPSTVATHCGWTPDTASAFVASRTQSAPSAATSASCAVSFVVVGIRTGPPIPLRSVGARHAGARAPRRRASASGKPCPGCRSRPGRRRSARAAWCRGRLR